MEVGMARRSHDFLSDNWNQLPVMKDARIKLLWPWMQHRFLEGDGDLDW
jgi:hypothetical protein